MRALVLAAGLGTRLRPWTLQHPKALVPVAGVPMLERVLAKLEKEGFDKIVVNVHHFGEQIIEYLQTRHGNADIYISDERGQLLDTGGGIIRADSILPGDTPLLVHNTDILSNASLAELMRIHLDSGSDATLLTSGRNSTRRLVFDRNGLLRAWHDLTSGLVRPDNSGYVPGSMKEEAFSGIYILNKHTIQKMREWSRENSFPIMDFFLDCCREMAFRHYYMPSLRMLDIGKPDSLKRAEAFLEDTAT